LAQIWHIEGEEMATFRKRNGKWHVQIRVKDYPSQTKTFISKKNAARWAREIENKIDQGNLFQSTTNRKITLRELAHRYIKEVLIYKRGKINETVILKAFMRQKFVNKSICNISSGDFASYRDKRLQKVKPATLLRELCIIQHLYSIANKEWGFNLIDPVQRIRKPSLNNKRERRLSNEEYNFLVKGNYPQVTLRNIIEIAYETGMRRSEILNIKKEHIKRHTLYIPHTKTGYSRTIPLTKRALYILNDTLLPFPLTANALRLAWDRLKRKGNINGLHFHDLRHEAISRFFEKGLSIPEVALISGHKDVRQLFRYTHLKAEDVVKKF